jgi:hypothetical protein
MHLDSGSAHKPRKKLQMYSWSARGNCTSEVHHEKHKICCRLWLDVQASEQQKVTGYFNVHIHILKHLALR